MPRSETDPGEALFRHTAARKIIWVEQGWYRQMQDVRLYRYLFEPEDFKPKDGSAGYYTSTAVIHPVRVERVHDLIDSIMASGAELRFTPNLTPIREAVLASRKLTEYSMIRMRNAAQPEGEKFT
jgi:hypothetical protein